MVVRGGRLALHRAFPERSRFGIEGRRGGATSARLEPQCFGSCCEARHSRPWPPRPFRSLLWSLQLTPVALETPVNVAVLRGLGRLPASAATRRTRVQTWDPPRGEAPRGDAPVPKPPRSWVPKPPRVHRSPARTGLGVFGKSRRGYVPPAVAPGRRGGGAAPLGDPAWRRPRMPCVPGTISSRTRQDTGRGAPA